MAQEKNKISLGTIMVYIGLISSIIGGVIAYNATGKFNTSYILLGLLFVSLGLLIKKNDQKKS